MTEEQLRLKLHQHGDRADSYSLQAPSTSRIASVAAIIHGLCITLRRGIASHLESEKLPNASDACAYLARALLRKDPTASHRDAKRIYAGTRMPR